MGSNDILAHYQEGPPNPNPPFDLFVTDRFNYPYTIRDTLTNERRTETWRTLHLENEYLRVTVLPDLGGHLYSCIDKISGREMFYANPSIKKALIGYRGAWAALGIEFNFPVSHNWMSMSPVDFATSTSADGSASIWVGNTDRVYGTAWRVQLTLQPGRAVLDQDVTLENPSDVRRRFYWWTNAAVEVGDDSRLIYPTRFMASHGFTRIDPWPVDAEGRDLSVIRNQTAGPVSMFTYGSREPFIGVYHPPQRYRRGPRGLACRPADEEGVVVGRGCGRTVVARRALRRPQRLRRAAGGPVPQPGDLRVSRAPGIHPLHGALGSGARHRSIHARDDRRGRACGAHVRGGTRRRAERHARAARRHGFEYSTAGRRWRTRPSISGPPRPSPNRTPA